MRECCRMLMVAKAYTVIAAEMMCREESPRRRDDARRVAGNGNLQYAVSLATSI